MGKIPEDFLPPKELWPEYLVPEEFADVPSSLNLADYLLDRHVREGRGDLPAVKFNDVTISYAELQRLVNQFGNALKEAGVGVQDRVGIRLINCPQAIVSVFAIEKIGAIPVPTSPLWAVDEVAYVAVNADLKYYIVNATLADAVEAAKPRFATGTGVIVIGGNPEETLATGNLSFEEMIREGRPELEAVMLDGRDIGLILYTSGTTGLPKGCVHFLRQGIIQTRIVNKYVYRMGPGDVLGGAAPVSFAAGFGTFTMLPFEGGAAVSLISRFSPPDMLELIPRHGITVFTGLPTSYRALIKYPWFREYDLRSLRLCTSGGDSLGADTLKAWRELTGMPVWEGLGSTEMLHLVTSNTMCPEPVPGSIGRPLPGVEAKVLDPLGKECKPGEVGSMIVKGPSGTVYWKPFVNEKRLLRSQKRGVIDGWNRLGDAVYADESGNIFFVSREDDMIKSSGYRISPADVEAAISRHPAVADVGVVGIPDYERGQITKAVIVLKPEYRGGGLFTSELLEFLKKRIAVYKLPRVVEYVDKLPRTPTGKLLRRKLRD
ncbi:MAG: AMP-binding protein [Syntrophobacteraceae bacterium]|nr:AMP-binding protein [Desulfobacteraceae bacterium]